MSQPIRQSDIDRFWAQVQPIGPSACWEWIGSIDKGGYGKFRWMQGGDEKIGRSHRVAYELLVGSVSAGLVLDHLCRFRHCVNPDHVEPVTQEENIRRGVTGQYSRRARNLDGHEVCRNGHVLTDTNTRLRGGSRHPHLIDCLDCIVERKARFARRRAA